MAGGAGRGRWRPGRGWTPRLRTVFVLVSLVILALPLGGVVLLRLYESVQIRRAESELLAQGAAIAAAWRNELRRELEQRAGGRGLPLPEYGIASRLEPTRLERLEDSRLRPVEARLNLTVDPVLPPFPDAEWPDSPPAELSALAGARLAPVLRETQELTLAAIRVIDYQGRVVASTRGELGASLAHTEEVRQALAGQLASRLRERVSDEPPPALDSLSRATRVRVFVAMPVLDGDRVWGCVLLSRTPRSVTQSLWGIRWYLLTGAVVLLAAVVLLSVFTARTVTQPIERLIAQARRVAAGEPSAAQPLERPGTRELAELSQALVVMARGLEQRAQTIRVFASQVSHALKTPLTSMRGSLELLQEQYEAMSAEERGRFLGNLRTDTEQLERLVRRLLELARAEAAEASREGCWLTEVLTALAERYRERGLAVELPTELPELRLPMAPAVLESLLGNLVDNAERHGGERVRVWLGVELESEPPAVVLTVSDDGPGIPEADRERVFDPFFTTARTSGGTGLGLPIVATLVRAHGGRIELSSRPGATSFRVWLPRS